MQIIKGERRYGVWAGMPEGAKEDKTRCIEEVWGGGRGMDLYQCSKKRGHGPEGLYCGIHDPAKVAAREAALREKWAKQSEADSRKFAGIDAMRDIKDPRAFMAHVRKVLGPEEMKKWEVE